MKSQEPAIIVILLLFKNLSGETIHEVSRTHNVNLYDI